MGAKISKQKVSVQRPLFIKSLFVFASAFIVGSRQLLSCFMLICYAFSYETVSYEE